jgi:hypothetical protein
MLIHFLHILEFEQYEHIRTGSVIHKQTYLAYIRLFYNSLRMHPSAETYRSFNTFINHILFSAFIGVYIESIFCIHVSKLFSLLPVVSLTINLDISEFIYYWSVTKKWVYQKSKSAVGKFDSKAWRPCM